MQYSEKVESDYRSKCPMGVVRKNGVDQHDLIEMIMRHGFEKEGKIWWFVYELMGHWMIDARPYFMSYKASSRVSEMARTERVIGRGTDGRLRVYALKEIIEKI